MSIFNPHQVSVRVPRMPGTKERFMLFGVDLPEKVTRAELRHNVWGAPEIRWKVEGDLTLHSFELDTTADPNDQILAAFVAIRLTC